MVFKHNITVKFVKGWVQVSHDLEDDPDGDPQSSDLLLEFSVNNPLNMTQQNPDSMSDTPVVCEHLSISQCIY